MIQERLNELLNKYHEGNLTLLERGELNDWFHNLNLGGTEFESWIKDAGGNEGYAEKRFENFKFRINQQKNLAHVVKIRWAAAAACISIILTGGIFFAIHSAHPTHQIAQKTIEILPGSNKAILKMANGKQLTITGAQNGLLANQGDIIITKTADGKLSYQNISGNAAGTTLYDTLIVPRAGQHQLTLADGTIVFVNADSKLRIPERFEVSNRMVELISGEADFQVAHHSKIPFLVKVRNQFTKDIGTEFNINAYDDEPLIKTTLIEGSVKISKSNFSTVLKPGQQSQVSYNESQSNIKVIDNADINEITAWKNGKFKFNGTSLENIMKQVSRWYDVDVVFADQTLKSKLFFAMSTRFTKASQLLQNLEETGVVKFKIEGRKITVLNNNNP